MRDGGPVGKWGRPQLICLYEITSVDAGGRITAINERTSHYRAYEYDNLDRMTSQFGESASEIYTYDATGNRTSKTIGSTTNTYTYPGNSHKVSAISGVGTRTYDANGNTLTSGGYSWTYDDRNRMREFRVSGTLTRTYSYNARGERVRRVVEQSQASNLSFLYDEAGHLLGEYTDAGDRVAEYVWLGDTLVGVMKPYDGTTYQYVETDHLGTPRAVINPASNAVIWRWDMTKAPFGDIQPDGALINGKPVYVLNLRYPGQYFDGAGPFYYNYYRDYDASTGRYLQSDPIGLEGGPSTFSYVGSSPLGWTDPLGLRPAPINLPWWTWLPAASAWLSEYGAFLRPWAPFAGLGWAAAVYPAELGADPCEMPGGPRCGSYMSERERGLPPLGVLPPVEGVCEVGPASRPKEQSVGGKSLWDPDGGEWRYHPGDRWHNPHWDHNPHDNPNSPWVNVPIGDLPPVKTTPDPKSDVPESGSSE
jgi:RHS repeat-associated protein